MGLNVPASRQLLFVKSTNNAEKHYNSIGRISQYSKISQKQTELFRDWNIDQTLLPVGIHAPSEAEREVIGKASIPTCPDTSLPWLAASGPHGWSAKMFLHQMIKTLRPHWDCSDTERLLSEQTPFQLRLKIEPEISLSDVIKKKASSPHMKELSSRMVIGLIRRANKRRKGIRVLLLTDAGTIPVTVIFGTGDSSGFTLKKNESSLPGSLLDGLMDFLKRHVPGC